MATNRKKKNTQNPGEERRANRGRTAKAKGNPEEWEHRVTDSADYSGTQTSRDRSRDYEITTDYRRVPRR